MNIQKVLIPTKVIRPGMHIHEVFNECGKYHIQALPFCNDEGEISGRLTLKNIMKFSCLPEHMVELAHLLGNQMSCIENAEEKAREIMCNPVEPYVRELGATITSTEPLIKAVAMMERNDTSYIFVVDDGEYKGVVTIQAIAQAMSSTFERRCS